LALLFETGAMRASIESAMDWRRI